VTPNQLLNEGRFAAAGLGSWKGMTDEELITAYRDGWGPSRDEAVEELFHRHQTRIVRWCYRFTRDRESGLDLAQEIFMRAFRNLDRYRGECRFSTWLYVIARNLCMSALQKRASEPVWAAKAITADLPDAAARNIHAAVETEQTRARNWRLILDTLNQIEAKVMLMHYGEELPLNTVSRQLGLTNKSGAKAYIVSAKRKLHAAIRNANVENRKFAEEAAAPPAAFSERQRPTPASDQGRGADGASAPQAMHVARC
jgi:RNA polymerase sigma-70 factor (ECF subfamily)